MDKFSDIIIEIGKKAEIDLKEQFDRVNDICQKNSLKVLNAFRENRVSYDIFQEINGYGLFDYSRDKMERVFADVFKAEDALVRPHIMSATNAIYIALSALLKHGDTMLNITGELYDTIKSAVGVFGDSSQSIIANGIKYEEIDLIDRRYFDVEKIKSRLSKKNVKLVYIQRSRGYAHREGISIEQVEEICKIVKDINKDIIVMVDNCYCEMVSEKEPIEVGADILVGSLMHNLGAGIASSGGYVVGKEKLVNMVAERLTAPGLGKALGANYNQTIKFLKGLYLSPMVVANAVKTAIFASYMFEKMGYKNVSPKSDEVRSDIVQTVDMLSREDMILFCKGIQKYSPIDGQYAPEPCEVPGYPHEEIMASGSFTSGSTIEFSCDGPLVEPYTLFLQGSLTYEYGKIAIIGALNEMMKNKK